MLRVTNYPFKHNYQIEACDRVVNGNLRRLIRLLKNIRADSDQNIDFSSFDISAAAYHMPAHLLGCDPTQPLKLAAFCSVWFNEIIEKKELRDKLDVIDGTRLIFNQSGKLDHFKKLNDELKTLVYSAYAEVDADPAKSIQFKIPEGIYS